MSPSGRFLVIRIERVDTSTYLVASVQRHRVTRPPARVEQKGDPMRQRIYPGANLAVIDVSGLLTCEVAKLGELSPVLSTASEIEDDQRESQALTKAREPVIVPPGYQAVLNVDLYRHGECRGGIVIILRPGRPTAQSAQGTRGLRTRLLSQTINLDERSALAASFVLVHHESCPGLNSPRRAAKTSALEVSPGEPLRLSLDDEEGTRAHRTIRTSPGLTLAELDVNTWSVANWWSRRSTRGLRADLCVSASSLNVYDFGSPPQTQRHRDRDLHAHGRAVAS